MGDLLQSSPLIEGLKRENPESEITLAVLDDFRGICAGFIGVDRIFPVEVNSFVPRIADSRLSLEEHYTHLKRVFKRLGGEYDLVINLSHTTLSAVFCLLIGCKDGRGMVMSEDGAIVVRNPWMDYFFNVAKDRYLNTINLVDMYNLTGDIDLKSRKLNYIIPEADKNFPNQLFAEHQGPFVGFQLGASSDDRQWNPESFGELAALLHQRFGWIPVVFGRGKERELLERMRQVYDGQVVDAVDKTSMSQLAAVVERCEMLVTNDTGTMHVAAAVGTPVTAIFLGEARAPDTGPYTEKALTLEANLACAPCGYHTTCLDHQCHRCVKPEDVLWAVNNFDRLTSGDVEQFNEEPGWQNLKLSRPLFEADGFWNLIPLIRRPLTMENLLMGFYRRMWKRFLNPERNLTETDFFLWYSEPSDPELESKLDSLRKHLIQLTELAEQGLEITGKMRQASSPPDVEALKRLTREMIIVDNGIYHIELTAPELSMIAGDVRLRKNNTEREDLDYIISLAEELYRGLKDKSALLADEIGSYIREKLIAAERVVV